MEIVQLRFTPEEAADDTAVRNSVAGTLKIPADSFDFRWAKRSIDARKKDIKINASIEVWPAGEMPARETDYHPQHVAGRKEVYIVGAGPAGLYAGLRALELGFRPVILERGKDVRSRRRDLAALNKSEIVNPESNYCFGEGGAGTYSDGKLYTRSKKRGDVMKALSWLVHFGAPEDILVDAHPHIGTNKLPQLIVAIREEIIARGGEVRFDTKLTGIQLAKGKLSGIEVNGTTHIPAEDVILATGHSARDIFYLLHESGIRVQAKPFALGVRVEHRQELIDRIQYSGRLNDDFLPPASYSLVTQVDGEGVFSFCMCPGGIVAPCATAQEEVVTNGWSPSKRNNATSNSGIVVTVSPEDTGNAGDPFSCLDFQKKVEYDCWVAAGKTQHVPAQRLKDFVNNVKSADLPSSSYQPGLTSVNLNEVLPEFITSRLRKAFVDFNRKMPGFLTNDALLHAPESRTSSPVSVPRDPQSCMHPDVEGLYPCGEGAGYAGGIISAAIDGMKCMDAVAARYA